MRRHPELVCSCVAGGSQEFQIQKTYQDMQYTFQGYGNVDHCGQVQELQDAENSVVTEKELLFCACKMLSMAISSSIFCGSHGFEEGLGL